MALIAPSILSADFARMGEEIRAITAAGADLIHVDVMDGHFVPNLTMGPPVISAIRAHTQLPFDVHLMIANAERYIEAYAQAGAQIISVQAEACVHLHRTLESIRQAGCKAGVVLNPATPLESIEYVLEEVYLVLVMTVNPGFGGQKFIGAMLPKIRRLRDLIDQRGLKVKIEVDGGVNGDTVARVAQAGGDIYVAGSAIFGKGDYARAIQELRDKIEAAGKDVPGKKAAD